MVEPGVTEELRTRAGAHLAEEARRRRLTTITVIVAVVAVAAYLAARWLG